MTANPSLLNSIRVGVAGWSYPDWRGIVYPKSPRPGEALELIAGLFDCVEINSTFYRDPDPTHGARWVATVERFPEFRFTAKVPRTLTHERSPSLDELRDGCVRVREGLAPLVESGRLDTLVAQFPPWFRDSANARQRVEAIVDGLRPLRVTVEPRHASFYSSTHSSVRAPARGSSSVSRRDDSASNGSTPFLRFLARLGAGAVNVDMPPGPGALPPSTINTNAQGYVRLHGRNSEAWYTPRVGRDAKYDYSYSLDELERWTERVLLIAERTLETYVITNNHFRGQAPANGLEIMALLGKRVPSPPASLVAEFPDLAGLVESAATDGART